jgi:hypothetical protein
MRPSLLTRIALLEAAHAPDLEPAYTLPELPASWWHEFLTVCQDLREGADVLETLGLTAIDIQRLLVQESGGGDAI